MSFIKHLFIFFFFIISVSFFAQKTIDLNFPIEYSNVSNADNYFLFQPVNGYFDFINNMPVLQHKIPHNYKVLKFDFKEEKLDDSKLAYYEKNNFSNEYKIQTRIQEQNSNNKNKLLLISCLRKKEDQIFQLKSINIRLELDSDLSQNIKRSNFKSSSYLGDNTNWFKLRNFNEGIHKISYNFLLNNSIISSDIPSDNIHLFSNNVGLLGTINNNERPDDIIQQSVFVNDGGDGVFSQGDYLLFYLKPSTRVEWNGENLVHVNHHFSDSAYFFLNISSNKSGNHLDSINHLSQNYSQTITSFLDFKYLENDQINLLKSGSQWLGDIYDLNYSYDYPFNFNNIGDSSNVRVKLVSKSSFSTAYFNLSLFGQSENIPINSSGSSYYSPVGKAVIQNFNFLNNPNEAFSINIEYDNNGAPSSKGYLDFIEVNCQRDLVVDNQQFDFHIKASDVPKWAKITLSNAIAVDMIWDITDLTDVKNIEFQKNGSELFFISNIDTNKHFIAIEGNSFQSPDPIKNIPFQNLHSLSTPDMVIITPIEFKNSADELKLLHVKEGLDVVVVTDEEIYNEFSGGIPDATAIKQFLRMFYVRENGNAATIPKYCLLLGDGTYDNKNKLGHGNNLLPVFESYESLSLVNTFATDDYYAILSDGASMQNTDQLNIAVGRLTVSNSQEAIEVVEKIKSYLTKADTSISNMNCLNNNSQSIMGDWRNKVILVSDDEDNNAYFTDTEIMSNKIETQKPQMNIVKIHSDAYAQQSSPLGERIPAASDAIEQKVNDGSLVVNYIGHGGETGWAHEGILTVQTIKNWNNSLTMPVFMTATCEFGRFDDHDRVSAGEYVLLNPSGAGIGLFTTTRLVYATPNEWLNRYFYDTVFDLVNYEVQSLGDIYVGTKNKFAQFSADPNYRKFALLGDPALKLAMPQINVVIDSSNKDTVRALSEVIVYGHIEDNYSNPISSFNGKASLTFYDKKSSFSTLGTNSGSNAMPFQMWKNIIYKGKSSIINGNFSFTFKVPKDISYNYGLSRMSFYAENGEIDASGYNDSLVIGGIDTNAVIDELGPEVELYLNDENFISGGISNNEPLLIVSIFDENGVNTVGNGIGHDIELIIDDDFTNSIVLNEYYESDLDTYKSGRINYEINQLSVGEHKLKIKVWDNYNNSSDKELFFNVVDDQDIQLSHVLNYPNPFTTNTAFYFEHNQNCNFLDVSIQVYNVSGRVVKRINTRIHNEGFRSQGIAWDGRDDYGDKLAQGVYLYNLKVVNEQGISTDKTESMFLLK